MKILVSGSSGWIGNNLVQALIRKGHRLVTLNRHRSESEPQGQLVWGEIQEFLSSPHPLRLPVWEKGLKGVEAIIHLSGAGLAAQRWTPSYKKVLWNSRVQTTESLVTLAPYLQKTLKVFISTSAVGFYGDQSGALLTEDSPKGEGFLSDLCGEWEKRLRPLRDMPHLQVVAFRLGVVLSREGGALLQMQKSFPRGWVVPVGAGRQYVSWIDLEDLISLYQFALTKKISGVYNAVSPGPVTHRALMKEMARARGRRVLPSVPGCLLKMIMGEMARTLLDSARVSSQKIQKAGFCFQFPTLRDSLLKIKKQA